MRVYETERVTSDSVSQREAEVPEMGTPKEAYYTSQGTSDLPNVEVRNSGSGKYSGRVTLGSDLWMDSTLS